MVDRFIVTGGAGFIGSALVRHLIEHTGHTVLVIDKLTYAANLDSLLGITGNPRFFFVRADINDQEKMRETLGVFRPDVVIHLAAESHVDRSIDGPGEFIRTNVVGTFSLLQAALDYWRNLQGAAKDDFRFLHVSTDEVFGSLGAEGKFDEMSRYHPTSPYAASKAAADHLVNAWHRTYGLPAIVSNCSNNFGPWQFPEKFIALTIANALKGRPLPLYGTGVNVRDWLYVADHARALVAIATRGRIGETYCVGAQSERSNLDVLKMICLLADEIAPSSTPHETLISFVADRPGHDPRYAIDPSKIMNDIGWRPLETFESGLRKTFLWYLENAAWWERIHRDVYCGERLGAGA